VILTQTRNGNHSPLQDTAYEDKLGDALEKLLDEGADDLEALSAGLNALGVTSPSAQPWTAESLQAELKRLGSGAPIHGRPRRE